MKKKKPRDVITIASHAPVLAAALSVAASGPVIELGGGAYSTPLLHWMCRAAGRDLLTLDSNPDWVKRLEIYRGEGHEVAYTPEMAEDRRLGERWALALADGGQFERADCLSRLHRVPIVVVHDTEPEHADAYPGMEAELAKYRFRLDVRIPLMETNQTSVVSDVRDPAALLRV